MLIQNYESGDFALRNGVLYYKGNTVSPANLSPILTVGCDELFIVAGRYQLTCQWLVIIQSRFPVFYECKTVDLQDKIFLHLVDGENLKITPYRDGVRDRLLIDYV